MVDVERFVSGEWAQNGYLVCEGDDAVVIDPGGAFDDIVSAVSAGALHVHAVLNTHAHYDHLGAVTRVVETYGAPFHLHPADADLLPRANFYRTLFLGHEPIAIPALDVELSEGSLQFGSLEIEVLHTPGHTPGSVCFRVGTDVFTGDTLMKDKIGRTDLPGGDRDLLDASIREIAERYSGDIVAHPGHGDPASLEEMLAGVSTATELH